MSVTRVQFTEREQRLGQIDKLVNSQVLHGSESLCKLLRYLGDDFSGPCGNCDRCERAGAKPAKVA